MARARKSSKSKLTECDRKKMVADQFLKGLEKLQEAVDAVADPTASFGEWRKPWTSLFAHGLPYSVGTGKQYNGTNVVSCLFACDQNGRFFNDPRWGTTNQWRVACGWKRNPDWHGRKDSFAGIKKWLWEGEGEEPETFFTPGEERRSTLICAWKPVPFFGEDEDTGERKALGTRMALVGLFSVYNAQQVACAPTLAAPKLADTGEKYADAHSTLDALGIETREGGDRAFYSIVEDYIQLPTEEQFHTPEDRLSTKAHEVVHATGHKSRLNREFGKRFGDDAYAFEELVAELGSVMLCAELGVEGKLQHHEYLASWHKRISKDPKALFTAASKAQAAATFVLTGGASAKTSDTTDTAAEATTAKAAA